MLPHAFISIPIFTFVCVCDFFHACILFVILFECALCNLFCCEHINLEACKEVFPLRLFMSDHEGEKIAKRQQYNTLKIVRHVWIAK